LDEILEVVCVNSAESARMSDLDHSPVGGLPPAEQHGPGRCGADGLTLVGLDVDSAVPSPEAAPAEPRGHGAVDRPHELRPLGTEPGPPGRAGLDVLFGWTGRQGVPAGG